MVNSVLDSSEAIIHLQRNIILSRTPAERAAMGIDMIESTYQVVKNSILNKFPSAGKGELIAMIFQRYYFKDFPSDKIMEIKQGIISFHNKKSCN